VNVVVAVHPTPEVLVIVYVVVVTGAAVGFAQVVQLRPVAGVHENEFAPAAVSTVLPPSQMALEPEIVIVGFALMLTVTLAFIEQPFAAVPVTV
jgi:hypothetical protein